MIGDALTVEAFLAARMAEEEEMARTVQAEAKLGWRWKHLPDDARQEIMATRLAHAQRVLLECAAKREIMRVNAGFCDEPESILAALSSVYADHPDYDKRWCA